MHVQTVSVGKELHESCRLFRKTSVILNPLAFSVPVNFGQQWSRGTQSFVQHISLSWKQQTKNLKLIQAEPNKSRFVPELWMKMLVPLCLQVCGTFVTADRTERKPSAGERARTSAQNLSMSHQRTWQRLHKARNKEKQQLRRLSLPLAAFGLVQSTNGWARVWAHNTVIPSGWHREEHNVPDGEIQLESCTHTPSLRDTATSETMLPLCLLPPLFLCYRNKSRLMWAVKGCEGDFLHRYINSYKLTYKRQYFRRKEVVTMKSQERQSLDPFLHICQQSLTINELLPSFMHSSSICFVYRYPWFQWKWKNESFSCSPRL